MHIERPSVPERIYSAGQRLLRFQHIGELADPVERNKRLDMHCDELFSIAAEMLQDELPRRVEAESGTREIVIYRLLALSLALLMAVGWLGGIWAGLVAWAACIVTLAAGVGLGDLKEDG